MKTIIGIDPGVSCGVAHKHGGAITDVFTLRVWEMFEHLDLITHPEVTFVVVEDARKMRRPTTSQARAMGAGWVRTLSGQIEDFLIEKQIPYKMVAPMRNGKKLNAETVKKITGWKERTNNHERDAIMIAWTN